MRYVAFLRGINVGGRKVLMADLQKVFEDCEFDNVKTLIASGNVLFDTESQNEDILREDLEAELVKKFGFTIPVILRTLDELLLLLRMDPFANIELEKGSRLYITLFANAIDGKVPIEKEGFSIIYVGKKEIASIVGPSGKTTELMNFIDKTFGKHSTMRNWNTIQKLLER